MSVILSQSSRWFARPLALVVAVLLTVVVATGFLGLRYWQERQAANLVHERSRQVLETLDRLKTVIADVEAQRRGYLLTLDPSLSQGLRRLRRKRAAGRAGAPGVWSRAIHCRTIVPDIWR